MRPTLLGAAAYLAIAAHSSLAAASDVPAVKDQILISGLPTLVERPASLFDFFTDASPAICVDFAIRRVGQSVTKLMITSNGMSGGTFVDRPTGPCSPSGASTLTLVNLSSFEHWVRLVLPKASFPVSASGERGSILLIEPNYSRVTVPIRLVQAGYSAFERSLLWFAGIGIPAALTAMIGLLVFQIQKGIELRSSEYQVLESLRRDSFDDLKRFFQAKGIFQNVLAQPDTTFKADMERELANRGILSALPRRTLNKVMSTLRRSDRSMLKRLLANAFPDFKNTIQGADQ